jgi:antitoxin MazE
LELKVRNVAKWGNSPAIRLPVAVVKALQLREGDDIEVLIAEERVFKVRKSLLMGPF